MLSTSLIQFSVDGRGCVPSLLFDLRVNYGGGNEDNGWYRHCCTQCPQSCSGGPPLTHASAGDSWTLMGKSGSVSCGVTAPFSWVLVCTRFCLCCSRRTRFRKGRGTRDQIDPLDQWKNKRVPKNIYFCFIDYAKVFDCVDHNKLESSERDENIRPPDLPPEKAVCRSGSNS